MKGIAERLLGRKRRLVLRAVGVVVGIVTAGGIWGLSVAWEPMGAAPEGARAERMAQSPLSEDGVFVNPQPLWNDVWGSFAAMLDPSDYLVPTEPLPVQTDTAQRLESPADRLRITWLGHSTALIELDGRRVLTDPIFGPSPFPLTSLGPQRWYEPPLPLEYFRTVDAVLISHDHYDHLDHPTILEMRDWDVPFIVPLGIGAHLEYWGIAPERITELEWWEEKTIEGLRIVSVPSRHASGRQVFDQMRTLWAGYALIGKEQRVMFSGDTGLFDDMALIGERLGPFDAVMIEVGAYHQAWPDWHIGPEQAIRGHRMMKGKLFIPIHWGLFNLALHGWTEPVERTWAAAEKASVVFATPKPGEVIDVNSPPPPTRWWPEVPWSTAEEHPIISTRNGNPDERYDPDWSAQEPAL